MFLNHFKMNAHPFAENPKTDWLLNDSRFEQALARLHFFQEQGNLALIIGQTGIGKSSLIELFQKSLPKNRYHPIYLHLTNLSPGSLLRLIVNKLGEAPRFGKDRLFLQIIERVQKNELETIMIIDEAHLISSPSFTDLRLLVSTGDIPLKIILSGQESLTTTLKRSIHADLVNRISVRCHLKGFSKAQTTAYIDHRVRCAGASPKIFDTEAKNVIHDYAGGVPRQINNIATAGLIHAASQNFKTISENMVNEVMAEFYLA